MALVSGAGDTASAVSSPLLPRASGTWCFSVVYNGSSTYAVSGDNTSGANLDSGECALVAPAPGDRITSPNAATATAGSPFSFPVTTSGSPVPTLKRKGKLPKGIKFVKNGDGTATLMGTPTTKSVGTYHIQIIATFGKGKARLFAGQMFTLTVVS